MKAPPPGAAQKLSAAARTLSLFDGKIDAERKPGENRDGSALLDRPRAPGLRAMRWYGKDGSWRYSTPAMDREDKARAWLVRHPNGYRAEVSGGETRMFDNVHDAANFIEGACR